MAFGRLITVFRSQPLVSSLSFDSGAEPLGALTNLSQYCFKISQFFRARIGKDPFNLGSVLRKTGTINSLPFALSDTMRTRRSSGLSTRLTKPLSNRRLTATL